METRDGNIEDLVDLLFDASNDKSSIGVVVPEAENTKRLFAFCLDLFLKALVRVLRDSDAQAAITNRSWDISEVSSDHIDAVKSKLLRVGIVPEVVIAPYARIGVLGTNAEVIELGPDNLRLSDYQFRIFDGIRGVAYTISFGELRHSGGVSGQTGKTGNNTCVSRT